MKLIWHHCVSETRECSLQFLDLFNFLKCKHHYLFHLIASPFAVCDLIQFLVPNIANRNISNKLELTLKRDHLSVLVSWFYRGSIHGLYECLHFRKLDNNTTKLLSWYNTPVACGSIPFSFPISISLNETHLTSLCFRNTRMFPSIFRSFCCYTRDIGL
jgi:hypothetical protein